MGRPAKPPKNGKRKQSKRPSGRLTALILAALLLGLSLRLYDLLRELRDARAEELSYAAQLAELQETNKCRWTHAGFSPKKISGAIWPRKSFL